TKQCCLSVRLRGPTGGRAVALAKAGRSAWRRSQMSVVSDPSQVQLRPIADIAATAGIRSDELEVFGEFRAKVKLSLLRRLAGKADGKLIIVTAITPTKAGEGKTTT